MSSRVGALHKAVQKGVKEDVRKALAHANINGKDAEGKTALHFACESDKNIDIVKHLISKKADVNVQDNSGWTPLHCAANLCLLKTCHLLLQQKLIDVSLLTADGTSSFAYLVRQDYNKIQRECPLYLGVLSQMVEKGADVNATNNRGDSPVHMACLGSNVESVRFLLSNDANVNYENARKQTALHWAVNSRKKAVVKVLMEYAADPFLQDIENKTAMEYAISSKQKELVEEMTLYAQACGKVSENASRLGHLSRLSKTKKRWQRLFFVLNGVVLTMFRSDSPDEKPIGYIDLQQAQIKEYTAREKAEKEYCFQIIVSQSRTEILAAVNEDELEAWLRDLRNAKSGASSSIMEPSAELPKNEDGTSSSIDGTDSCKQQLFALLDVASNNSCAECASRVPDWVSLKHGTFICFSCAEIYSDLGILPIKSIYLDSFDLTEVMFLKCHGNAKSNSKWEPAIPLTHQKPSSADSSVTKLAFITAKYLEQAFLECDDRLASAQVKNLKLLVAQRLRSFKSVHKARLNVLLVKLGVSVPVSRLKASQMFIAIDEMLKQNTFDASCLPNTENDFVGIGYNSVIFSPCLELAQYVLGALKNPTDASIKQRRSKLDTLLSLFVMHFDEMRDVPLSNIMQWWLPQALELIALSTCEQSNVVPKNALWDCFQRNTATALYLLTGDYLPSASLANLVAAMPDFADLSSSKQYHSAKKALRDNAKQLTEQLRKIVTNLRKHYQLDTPSHGQKENTAATTQFDKKPLLRTVSLSSTTSMGNTWSGHWSSPPNSPRGGSGSQNEPVKCSSPLFAILHAPPNPLTTTLAALITELPDSVCQTMLELEKNGASFAPGHLLSDGVGETLQFGEEGVGLMTAINLLHQCLTELRVAWPHVAPARGSDKFKWLIRQVLCPLLLLRITFAQAVPFCAPEMWTSWQGLHSLFLQSIAFLAGCALHQVDPKHAIEILSQMLVQLRWTISKLVEIQGLEEAVDPLA